MQRTLAWLHDIGKGGVNQETGQRGLTIQNGITHSAGHEIISGQLIPQVFKEFEAKNCHLPAKTKKTLQRLVLHHGAAYPLIIEDLPVDSRGKPLEDRMDTVLQEIGLVQPEGKISLFINVVADLMAGRSDRLHLPEEETQVGFTDEQKAKARQLLRHYLKQLPDISGGKQVVL